MDESWKIIENYQSHYLVSNQGRVLSLKYNKKKFLKPILTSHGYLDIGLCLEGKKKMIRLHRLVALAFIPNPHNKKTINHKNGIKTDCRAVNLEWSTHQENVQHSFDALNREAPKGKYHSSSKPVLQLTKEGIFIARYASTGEAMRKTGIKKKGIQNACRNECKSYKGYKWEYATY